jgi:hypothetical protein
MNGAMTYCRPVRRADCLKGPRPCPWIGCRWHLCWEHHKIKRAILSNADPREVAALILSMPDTCVLDLSEEALSTRQVANALNVTHQAIAQSCVRALDKLRRGRPHQLIRDWRPS